VSTDEQDDKNARFVREDGLAAAIAALAEPIITELGYRLVRVKISGSTVQIMADRAGGAFAIEDCTAISRRLSPVMDLHDPMPGGYFLEVSSPGIDRPLVRPSDFEDWAGFEAKIELRELLDGRRRFRGVLDGYEDGEARLKMTVEGMEGEQVVGLPVALIQEARLVMTDELIRASLSRKPEIELDGEDLEAGDAAEDKNG
jgi:ribosome maturation factor RimP